MFCGSFRCDLWTTGWKACCSLSSPLCWHHHALSDDSWSALLFCLLYLPLNWVRWAHRYFLSGWERIMIGINGLRREARNQWVSQNLVGVSFCQPLFSCSRTWDIPNPQHFVIKVSRAIELRVGDVMHSTNKYADFGLARPLLAFFCNVVTLHFYFWIDVF